MEVGILEQKFSRMARSQMVSAFSHEKAANGFGKLQLALKQKSTVEFSVINAPSGSKPQYSWRVDVTMGPVFGPLPLSSLSTSSSPEDPSQVSKPTNCPPVEKLVSTT